MGALRAAGWAAALAGDTARGRELFEQSEAELVPPSSPLQAALDVARSRVWRSLGEHDEAGSSARQAVAGGERHDLTWPQAAGHRELGLLAIDRSDTPTAIAELEAALELFRVLQNPRDESVTGRLLDAARSGD